jgi:Family of unknown function (DUF6879)
VGTVPPFRELIAATSSSAVHLEMRDYYAPDGQFAAWKAGTPRPVPAYPAWYDLVREHTARGVRFRRARIVSEPVSDYIRFEHEATAGLNVAAGEEVRWLPRRRASDLCLPGNDFWLFDGRLIRFHHFDGDGRVVEDELCEDPAVARMCSAAFEAVWERAVPHADYRLP